MSYKETKSLGDFVKAAFTIFHSWDRVNNGRKIHSMGNFWPLSSLKLSVLFVVQGLPGWIEGHLKRDCSESERR